MPNFAFMMKEMKGPDAKELLVLKRPFPITGMTCASCAINVEKTLKRQTGVVDAVVNLADSSALVEYKPVLTNPLSLKKAVKSAGYDLLIPDSSSPESHNAESLDNEYRYAEVDPAIVERQRIAATRSLKQRMIWAIALSIPLVIISMSGWKGPVLSLWHGPFASLWGASAASYIMWALATPVIAVFGRPFFVHAWQQARHGRANMDTLVAVSTGCAYCLSVWNTLYPRYLLDRGLPADVYFEASSVVIAFVLLGKWLEDRAKASAGTAIRNLMGLQPAEVTILDDRGGPRIIPISQVSVGDILIVRPGERIAVDGILVQGESYIDESMLTGEPVPVPKQTGASVYAGTLNGKGSIRLRAAKVGKDTLLSGIIRRVREAQGSKAPIQRLVDKVAGIFVPVVIGIALLTFLGWWLIGGTAALPHAFLSFVSVLVIACPCALGLATPTAILVGVGKGAENGLFIKDAESLERLRTVSDLVVDKTGTLTEGKPSVTDLRWFMEGASPKWEAVLYSLESASEHPLAEAICAALKASAAAAPASATAPAAVAPVATATAPAPEPPPSAEGGIPLLPLEQVLSVTGSGIQANYNGALYLAGNPRWLQSRGLTPPPAVSDWIKATEAAAGTVVLFSMNRTILAGIALADKVRPNARAAVSDLQSQGITLHMLTGDNPHSAAYVSEQTGIVHFKASLLPAEKADYVVALQKAGKTVAMAGDGINDAEGLAQADVGIAMGTGTDIAMQVAGVTLVQSDLSRIPIAIRLSVQTIRTIRQNLFFAFIYNVVGIPIAAGVLYPLNGFLLSPMIAGAAMALSSVTVVGNSLRLKMS